MPIVSFDISDKLREKLKNEVLGFEKDLQDAVDFIQSVLDSPPSRSTGADGKTQSIRKKGARKNS